MSEKLETTSLEKAVKEPKQKKPKSKARKVVEWVLTIVFGGLFLFLAVGQIIGMANKSKNYNQTLTYNCGTFVIRTNSMEPEYPVNTAIITYKEKPNNIVKEFNKGKKVDVTFYSAYLSNNSKYDYSNYRPGNIDVYYYGNTVIYGEPDTSKGEYDNELHYLLSGQEPVYPSEAEIPIITHRLIDYHIDETKKEGEGKYTFVVAGINISNGTLSETGQYQLLTENELLGIVKVNSQFLGKMFSFITAPFGLLVFLLIPAFYLVITSVLDIFKALKDDDEVVTDNNIKGSSSIDGLSLKDKERLKKEMLNDMLNNKKGDDKK